MDEEYKMPDDYDEYCDYLLDQPELSDFVEDNKVVELVCDK